MRELTWRLWDKKNKVMTCTKELVIGIASEEIDNFVFMQYTEVEDNNKKLVCEGDIVMVFQDDEWYNVNRDSGGFVDYDRIEGFRQLGVIEFHSASYAYKTVSTLEGKHEDIHLPVDWLDRFIVVGNIFEDQHMLQNI